MLKNALSLSILSIFFALVTSCGGKRTFVSPYPEEAITNDAYRVNNAEELTELLAANTEPIETLWVKFGVSVRQEGEKIAPSFDATAMYKAPDSIMFGIGRFEIGRLVTILIEGDDASFYAERERTLYTGTLEELTQKLEILGGLSPADLVSAASVQRSLYEALTSGRVAVVEQGDYLLTARRDEESGRQFLWLARKADGLVEELLVRTPTGRDQLRIRFQEYRLHENPNTELRTPWPERLRITVPSDNITVEADAKEYRIAPDLPAFRLRAAKETYPLSRMVLETEP